MSCNAISKHIYTDKNGFRPSLALNIFSKLNLFQNHIEQYKSDIIFYSNAFGKV